MAGSSFFDELSDQSHVKAEIVRKYFWAWAKVIIPSAKKATNAIAYIDLFAGPGRYKDGAKSTPIMVLEHAINDPDMRSMLITIFNDLDADNIRSLQKEINSIPGIAGLKHKPQVHNEEVGTQIVKMFDRIRIPTLFFVDPWGYKGLSLQLINPVLQNWGCDCIFFFNYNRINMGLNNDAVKTHMEALFGDERASRLREQLDPLSPPERELVILESISQALHDLGGKFVLPFRFKTAQGSRTSHHLIFVTKHFRGYEIMKDIMAKESSSNAQGVPSFEYNPATEQQPFLFELTRPLDDLAALLLETFSGQT